MHIACIMIHAAMMLKAHAQTAAQGHVSRISVLVVCVPPPRAMILGVPPNASHVVHTPMETALMAHTANFWPTIT